MKLRYLLLTIALVPSAVYAKPPATHTEPFTVPATSTLHVLCEADGIGAEVSVNGKFKGECPLDIQVAPGRLTLRAEKKDASSVRIFEQEIRIGGGVVKKIEVVLSKRLYAAGRAESLLTGEVHMTTEIYAGMAANMMHIPGKNYEIGKTEVTQGQWKAIMGNNPSKFANCGDTCPVEQVSWNEVQEFILMLNQMTGRQYRLPTEAEWEYACYGGSKTEYCGGDELGVVGWYGNDVLPGGNSGHTTHPVGQKKANGYGLYDMSGNVWEWMNDCYNNDCSTRLYSGGSWYTEPQVAHAFDHLRSEPASHFNNIGFRLARTLP